MEFLLDTSSHNRNYRAFPNQQTNEINVSFKIYNDPLIFSCPSFLYLFTDNKIFTTSLNAFSGNSLNFSYFFTIILFISINVQCKIVYCHKQSLPAQMLFNAAFTIKIQPNNCLLKKIEIDRLYRIYRMQYGIF